MGPRLLEPIATTLNANSSVFLQFFELPANGHLVGRRCYIGDHPRSVEVYAEGVYNLDPVLKPSLQWLHSGTADQGAYVSLLSQIPGWHDQAYYREFLFEFDIRHVLAVAVPVRSALGSEMICLGFHRAHEAEPFCSDEVRLLQSLAPLIQSVICNLAHREAVTLSGTILDTVCDCHAGLGFVILDDDLLVRHANRRGLMQLGLYDSGGQGIQAASVFGELRQRLLDVESGVGRRGRFTLPVSQPNIQMPLQLDVDVRAFRASDYRTYYLLVTSERSDRKRLDDCCAVFGLSERQSDVARLVCAGQSNGQISRTLGITLRTVENHLRSIYMKLAVNNRMQLVSKVLDLN